MDAIVRKLIEGRRIDEVRKKVALEELAKSLTDRFSSECHRRKNPLMITPNTEDACVDIQYEDLEDMYKVYPQKTKISNENSNKLVYVHDIEGAYIEGTKVYNSDGELIGEAMVRMKAIHNKSDYSSDLESAEYRYNSKLSDMKKLEKYVSREEEENGR